MVRGGIHDGCNLGYLFYVAACFDVIIIVAYVFELKTLDVVTCDLVIW